MKNSQETNANRLSSHNLGANSELDSRSQNWINIANEALTKINHSISSIPQKSELNSLLLDVRELFESWIRLMGRDSPLAWELTQLVQSSCELLEIEYRTSSIARTNPNFTAILNSTRAWLAEHENNPLNQWDLDQERLLRGVLSNSRENQILTGEHRHRNPHTNLPEGRILRSSSGLQTKKELERREEELSERLRRQDEQGLRHRREDEDLQHNLREEARRIGILRQEELLERIEREELLREQFRREEERKERDLREQERHDRELREDERRERNRREELRRERNLREDEQREREFRELLRQERLIRYAERCERIRAEEERYERNNRGEELRERNRREEVLRELNRGEIQLKELNRRQENLHLHAERNLSLPLSREQLLSGLTPELERKLLDETIEDGQLLHRVLNEAELENAAY